MKFTAANVANALRRMGISISKNDGNGYKVDGIEISSFGGIMSFEHRNWTGKANREEELEKIINALNELGFRVKEFETGTGKKTGAFRITSVKK